MVVFIVAETDQVPPYTLNVKRRNDLFEMLVFTEAGLLRTLQSDDLDSLSKPN